MCGIIGFTGKTNSEVLERMTNCISHRGPDDTAYIVNSDFSVGYRRLAIIDLSENIYPIENEKKNIEMVLNGEIYNFEELRDELMVLGHRFKTKSDGETIVHGYEEWGYDVLEKLRGMFVFVLLDKTKNELFVARDRLGIKPLYYAKHDGRVIFGSEIKGLFAGFDIPREPDDRSVYRFLSRRIHDTDENTFFKNVKRLMAGHFMVIKGDGSFDINRYWEPEFNPEFSGNKKDAEYAEEFGDVFSEAVKLHLIADVPVGVTLSGGLDSSGITSLSKQLYEGRYNYRNEKANKDNKKQSKSFEVIAFSAVHPGETVDESEFIDSVVEHTGIRSIKIQPEVDTFWEDLETWVYFQEEPVISGAPYAYYTVMREAAKHVTVLLSGQGGDELLAGYIPYFSTYLSSAWDQKKLWPMLRESWMGRDLYFGYMMKKLRGRFSSDPVISPFQSLNDDFVSEFQGSEADFVQSKNLNERLFLDVLQNTSPSFLRYEDKNSMAHSLESRVPFFDHKVVEYIFNLPIDQKIKFGWNRFIYREAMKGVIPEMNRTRRSKIGFVNPEWEWIERKAEKFEEIFMSDSFKSRKYWDAGVVMNEFRATLDGKRKGDQLFFWRLFIVEMWMRGFVDGFRVRG